MYAPFRIISLRLDLLDLLLIFQAGKEEIDHYNQKSSPICYYLDYHEEVDNVFDHEERVLIFEIVLAMRDARLNEQVNVAKGGQQDEGIVELL